MVENKVHGPPPGAWCVVAGDHKPSPTKLKRRRARCWRCTRRDDAAARRFDDAAAGRFDDAAARRRGAFPWIVHGAVITIARCVSFLDYFGLLTYVSINVALHYCLESGSSHVLQPALPGAAVKRHVFVTAGLNDLLTDPESAVEQRARFVDLRADLDAFIGRRQPNICLAPFGARDERIARLAPVDKGLCEFRSRHPGQAFGHRRLRRATASSRWAGISGATLGVPARGHGAPPA